MSEGLRNRMRALGAFGNSIGAILPGTKMICALITLFGLINLFASDGTRQFSINISEFFSTIPRPWILFSSGFYERSILLSIIDFVFIVTAGRTFEAAWGTREFIRFILTVLFTSTISTTLVLLILSLGFSSLKSGTNVCGMSPLYMAFLVATKQVMSDLEVPVASLFYVRSSNLPLTGFFVVFVLSLFLGPFTFVFGFCGFVSSWVYLRFFQRKTGGIVGDPSSIFAMHTFFPEAIQGPVKAVEAFFGGLGSLNIFKRFGTERNNTENNGVNEFDGHITVKVNPADAERRKQIALRAVNEKLDEDNN